MNVKAEPEVWLPDPVERCQDGLRRSWHLAPQGDCWYLPRTSIERFFQEDRAGTQLPHQWQKLLSIANLPADSIPDLPETSRFSAQDFEELLRWSKRLGGKLDLDPEPPTQPDAESDAVPDAGPATPLSQPGRPAVARNHYAFIVTIAVVSLLGLYWLMDGRLRDETNRRLSAERRIEAVDRDLSNRDAELGAERDQHIAALTRAERLAKQNKQLEKLVAGLRPPGSVPVEKEIRGVDLTRFTLTRNAGPTSGWDVRSPSYSALRKSPPRFTWKKGPEEPATIDVLDEATQRVVWSHAVKLSDGEISGAPSLPAGRYYTWSIVTESGEGGLTGIPFYILSSSDEARLGKALAGAKSDAERAAVTARFGLFDDLGSFGAAIKRRLALGETR